MSQPAPKFATPSDVLNVVGEMETLNKIRGQNRAMIARQFNGMRPYTDAEVEENQIQVNTNFLEGYKVAVDGNLQVNGALLNKPIFFTVRCIAEGLTQEKREKYGNAFTKEIHKFLSGSDSPKVKSPKKLFYLMRNRNASLVLFGIGALVWMDKKKWMPKFVALDDLLIPTDTGQDFDDDLSNFGVNVYVTPYELNRVASKASKGWNKKLLNKLLTSMKNVKNFTPDLYEQPEKLESLWKQHGLYMNSDAVPKVKLTHFFYQKPDDGKWYRKVVIRDNGAYTIPIPDEFLYEEAASFADDVDQIIHVQFGDGNVVAPLKFHSVRGLGVLLFSVVELLNRFRCQMMQHALEQLNTWLRVTNPTDKDRPKILELGPYAVIQDGVSFVKADERHQVEAGLLEFAMAQGKQIIADNSSSYVQDIDNGTSKEQTLGEAQIKLQSANKVVAGTLGTIYVQEVFLWLEVKRRFCMSVTDDPDVKAFQKAIGKIIPKNTLRDENFVIDMEKAFGAGDQTLAIQEVTQLMGISQKLDPDAQRTVLRKFIAVVTRNFDLAAQLVPEKPNAASDGTKAAEDVFATAMLGLPIVLRQGIEHRDYVQTWIGLMNGVIDGIQQQDNIGTPDQVVGLTVAAQNVEQHIEILSQDPQNKEFVTAAKKALGKMMNDVRAFAQRQQQQAEAKAKEEQDQGPQIEIAKAKANIAIAEEKLKINQTTAAQKMQISQAEAAQRMQQSEAEHQQKLQQQRESHQIDAATSIAKTNVDIATKEAKAKAAPKSKETA